MKKLFLYYLFFLSTSLFAQQKNYTSSEIFHRLQKLNVVGNVMYVAAHPDDENTLLITWLSNEKKVRTAYIAMTRGDGGQNLLGTEQGSMAGLLRTQELLKARSVDGGEQYFTRAIDFGFTKTTDEALLTWGKEKVLADLVWQIRKFQPDVVINRFPPDERAGHGHHSASAVLAAEAFDAAADPTKFPDQLRYVSTWQVKRLFWNHFGRGFTNAAPEAENSLMLSIGDYNPILGKAYTEIAAEARSMHRSQGFGAAKVRNERTEYLTLIKGTPAKTDMFEGIDLSWKRLKGGEAIEQLIAKTLTEFNFTAPENSLTNFVEIYKAIASLEESVYKTQKLSEIKELILACSGLWFEANPTTNMVSRGDSLQFFVQLTNRSKNPITFQSFVLDGKIFSVDKQLAYNKQFEQKSAIVVSNETPFTTPYWLEQKPEKGFYSVSNQELIGLPFTPPALQVTFNFILNDVPLSFTKPLQYKYVEPSFGEIYKPLEVRPAVLVSLPQKVYLFNGIPKTVEVKVTASTSNQKGEVMLSLANGWKVLPTSQPFELKKKNESKIVRFDVTPPTNVSETDMKAIAQVGSMRFDKSLNEINYEHIPPTILLTESSAKAIKLSIVKKGNKVGYIAGAGDEVPAALQQIGYEVITINEQNFQQELSKLSTILIGVRAYNTEDWLALKQAELMRFVENGGTLVTQYQTQAFYGRLKTESVGPYPFTIGRERVTNEEAEVKFLQPSHPILTTPNKITQDDFIGWIQERGLYFANNWSDKYQTILAMNDKGENAQEGSLLYTSYGKGHFVFTGLAFFRQLPAGVPGAYRLMANILSLGK